MSIYKIGDRGAEIKSLQKILAAQGFNPGLADGFFGDQTKNAVIKFQQTHLDEAGHWLVPDGEVGPKTWWALEHPSGDSQRSGLEAEIPAGLTPQRLALCRFELALWKKNVHEIPDGSNGGDGVDVITGGHHDAWCMHTQQYSLEHVLGHNPFGARQPSCYSTMVIAKEKGWWNPRKDYHPIPGDLMIMLHSLSGGWSPGHTGMVLRVGGFGFNTIEGNCGNRIKLGYRKFSQVGLAGFINVFGPGEQPTGWEHGVIAARAVAADSTR